MKFLLIAVCGVALPLLAQQDRPTRYFQTDPVNPCSVITPLVNNWVLGKVWECVGTAGVNNGTWKLVSSGANGITALTGDVTATGPGAAAATLAASGVSAATYGDATHVPQITIDAKGRATAVANVAITGTGGGGIATCNATNVSVNALQCGTGFTLGAGQIITVTTGALTGPTTSSTVTITLNSTTYTLMSNTGGAPQSGQIFVGAPDMLIELKTTTALILQDILAPGASGLVAITKTGLPYTVDVLTGAGQLCPAAAACNKTGLQSEQSSAVQTLTATSTITVSNNIQVTAASPITLTSTPTIPSTTDGTEITITNTGTNAITFQDKSALSGSLLSLGGANISVAGSQSLTLRYNVTLGLWVKGAAASGIGVNADCVSKAIAVFSVTTNSIDCAQGGGGPLFWDGFVFTNTAVQAVTATADTFTCNGTHALSDVLHSAHSISITGNCTLTSAGTTTGAFQYIQACTTGAFTLTFPSTYKNPPLTSSTFPGSSACAATSFYSGDGTNYYRLQ